MANVRRHPRLPLVLAVLGLFALAAVLAFALARHADEAVEAAGPGPGMALVAPAKVFVGNKFTIGLVTNPSPNVDIAGFAAEVLVSAGLKYNGSNNCAAEVKVTVGGDTPEICTSFVTALGGGHGLAVLSQISPTPAALDQSVPSTVGIGLANLSYTCNTPGNYTATLTTEPTSPDGALYVGTAANAITVKSDPADTLTINCQAVDIDVTGQWQVTILSNAGDPATCAITMTQDLSNNLTSTGTCQSAALGTAKLNTTGTIDPSTGVSNNIGTLGLLTGTNTWTAAKDGSTLSGTYSLSNGDNGIFTGGRLLESASAAIIADDGGTVDTGTGDDFEAELTLPAGSLPSDETVTIEVFPPIAAPDLQALLTDLGDPSNPPEITIVFNLKPDGLVLNSPAQLTLTYTDNPGCDEICESAMGVVHFNGTTWEWLAPKSQDTSANTITVNIDGFSDYPIYEPPPSGDSDADGCTDVAEQQTEPGDQSTGGLRDHFIYWDFFDMNFDKAIAFADFLLVLQHFNTNDNGGAAAINRNSDPLSADPGPGVYHPRFDRGGQTGANGWNVAPPNGAISFPDFLTVLVQFGHSCT